MGEESKTPTGILASLRRLVDVSLAIAHNRLELLLVELQEERLQFFELLLLVAVAVVLAAMTLITITVTLVVLCLRAERPDLLIGIMLVYMVVTGVAFWRLRQRLHRWAPFSSTLAELKKDKEWLVKKS
jgi:uncharacterized membrane protein YqjE